MDVAKLDKMKVVDLRNELQARGLDTKGVKAVLVERLRAFLESGDGGGGGTPGTPGTPGRRSRRTRSMTRSPSPSPVKKVDTALETLEEESVAAQKVEENIETATEKAEAEEIYGEQEEADSAEAAEDADAKADEQSEQIEDDQVEGTAVEEQSEHQQEEEEEGGEDVIEKQDGNVDVDDRAENAAKQAEATEKQKANEEQAAESEEKQMVTTAADESTKVATVTRKHSQSRSRSRSHSKERRDRSRSHSRSRSKSRSHSPRRRSGAGSPTKTEEATNPEDEPTIEDKQFGLSWFDSDLHLRIDPVTFTSAKPMTHEIYSLVWSGVRTNYGVREGKVCYEVRLAEETQMGSSHQFRDEPHVRGFRVGFSMPDSTLLLGEAKNSFAYCESGRKALNSEFTEYAKPYQLDDVIGCYLDLESTPCTIKYTLNGEDMGVAFEFDKSILGETGALFPHIVTKGYEFHVNFADNENLLVNVERPKRRRQKPRKEKPNEEKDKEKETLTESNQENWKVVDEAKADDDEKTEEESMEVTKVETADKDGDIGMKEVEKDAASEEISEAKKDTEEKAEDAATAENAANVADDAAKATENGENVASSESRPTAESSVESKSTAEAESDDGPSPNKRPKLEDEKRDNATSEDEYEEVVPEPRDPVSLLPDYELIALIPEEKYVPGPQRPDSRKECEVILLVGLPGAGKTHWALNHIKENQDKRYEVIGADSLITKMTVDGAPRKSIHKGRWERVNELCLNSLSSLEEIATKRRRNFILDQTNAYASAQRRKMKGFSDFKRIAVVCIPNEDELKRRNTEKSEKGNAYSIRESTLNNLRANFTLPSLEFGWFDDIIYTDLSGEEAKEEVKKYNEKGKKALDANPSKRYRRDHYQRDDRRHNDGRRDFNRWSDRRGGHPGGGGGGGGGGNRWGGGGGGGNGGGYRSGWRDDRGYGGGGGGRGYDNRNNRYNNGPQNWMHNNNRGNRYDDRYNRSGGGGGGGAGRYDSGGRYDAYGGGGSRDYRDRDRDRNAGGGGRRDNYRSGGGGGGNQRDFRPGHRDNRTEDSRGGYERSAASKYGSNEGYGQYNSGGKMQAVAATVGGKTASQDGGKWSSYAQHQPHQQQQHHAAGGGNWQQHHQYQQQPAAPQQYWGYNEMQGYGNQQQQQQQQWQSADPGQQQEWMSWWQQQGNTQQQQQQAGAGTSDANQYWSQYAYPTQAALTGGGADGVVKK